MSAPKVLIVTGEYPPLAGGVGDYTANLRLALATMGIRSAVLASDGAAGEDVRTVRRWSWASIAQVLRTVRAEQANLVHIQYQAGAFAMHPVVNALPSLLASRVPVVTAFHDLRVPYLFPKAGRLRKSAITRMARGSSAVIVTNPADGRALANEGIATVQVPIGPNLPPPGHAAVVERDTVGFFGFPARSKGVLDLIEALATLPTPRPTLVLIGAQGEPATTNDIVAAAEIDRLAAASGITVRRTGYLEPSAASVALACCSVIALPFTGGASLRSGSLLAALQAGRPVIATRSAHEADLGDLASMSQLRLVERGRIDALSTAIADALSWGGNASPLPPAFRWQSIATEHVRLYRQLLDERRA